MKSPVVKRRSVYIDGHKTSVTLEDAFWSSLKEIADAQGAGWVHELKHDGYRLQIHARDGRVRLYTINAADWSNRYPLTSKSWIKAKNPKAAAAMRTLDGTF